MSSVVWLNLGALVPVTWTGNDPHVRMSATLFSTGTTGHPKGVQLSYNNYAVNRQTFEQFLGVRPDQQLVACVTNPMHHTVTARTPPPSSSECLVMPLCYAMIPCHRATVPPCPVRPSN